MSTLKIAQGHSSSSDWKDLENGGIRVTVNTSDAGFQQVPHYLITLEGDKHMWKAQGAAAVYNPSINSFQIILKFVSEKNSDGKPIDLTAAYAKTNNWIIRWTAILKIPS